MMRDAESTSLFHFAWGSRAKGLNPQKALRESRQNLSHKCGYDQRGWLQPAPLALKPVL